MNVLPPFYPFAKADATAFEESEAWTIVTVGQPLWSGKSKYGSNSEIKALRICVEIYNIIRKCKGRVLHEPHNNKFIEDDSEKPVLSHRFYFSDRSEAVEFKNRLPTIKTSGQLFPEPDELKLKNCDTIPCAMIVAYPFSKINDTGTVNLWLWCQDNLRGRVFDLNRHLGFEFEEDATMFLLKHKNT